MSKKKDHIENIGELRKFLIDSIHRLDRREIDVTTAKAFSNLSGKILKTTAQEMEYAKMQKQEKPSIPFLES